jgi:hypothetical protein
MADAALVSAVAESPPNQRHLAHRQVRRRARERLADLRGHQEFVARIERSEIRNRPRGGKESRITLRSMRATTGAQFSNEPQPLQAGAPLFPQ